MDVLTPLAPQRYGEIILFLAKNNIDSLAQKPQKLVAKSTFIDHSCLPSDIPLLGAYLQSCLVEQGNRDVVANVYPKIGSIQAIGGSTNLAVEYQELGTVEVAPMLLSLSCNDLVAAEEYSRSEYFLLFLPTVKIANQNTQRLPIISSSWASPHITRGKKTQMLRSECAHTPQKQMGGGAASQNLVLVGAAMVEYVHPSSQAVSVNGKQVGHFGC